MKRNKKLESKFFGFFQILHVIKKQAYKLELPIKWKIYNVFYVSLLKQDTTKKRQINKTLSEPKKELKFKTQGNKEYEIKAIIDSAVYGQKINNSNQMPGLYYLVL